ncbi:LuxR C-terminal-related transcriptional regulator [uncultured Dokdonia sp.]|uniref:LuxR C-terminal-related transcriptional regulator n=1 Tax=uncultured Dokdonia sp. TaxID=575653 RepID=UPI00261BE2B4|nr:LuxR C-terminal-related transcriptional regulator [uncultured Dokdonia sp.]
MRHRHFILTILFFSFSWLCIGQYEFSGHIDVNKWEGNVYLSIVKDYRKISGIYPEQIINKTTPDSLGFFSFSGNNLSSQNNIYRIHIDSCPEETKDIAHFTGHCLNSKEVLFVANNTDTIKLPFTFDQEIFCNVTSTNEKANTFIKIDSLKELMRYEFGSYRSQANWDLNAKNWFTKFQEYGQQLNEPLAELYSYAFLSDRSKDIHKYYLQDLNNTTYYNELLQRLEASYPDQPFTKQYKKELAADYFLIQKSQTNGIPNWVYMLIALLGISILMNIYYFFFKRNRSSEQQHTISASLTKQEQKVLDLILQNRTNKEIASEIFVSVSTVKTHINSIYKKLNVSNRDEVKSLYKTT